MSKAKKLLSLIEQNEMGNPPSADSIQTALAQRLVDLGFDDVEIDNVEVDYDGNITVDFADMDGSILSVMFYYDSNSASATIIDDDGKDYVVFDLDPLAPAIQQTPYGTYLDLLNLTWLNKSTLGAIFTAGEEFDFDDEVVPSVQYDAFGNILGAPAESASDVQNYVDKFKMKMNGSEPDTAFDWINSAVLSPQEKGQVWQQLKSDIKRWTPKPPGVFEADNPGRPPKAWFDKMAKEIKDGNPDYSDEQVNATVGNIWHNQLDDAKRKEILNRYEAKEARTVRQGRRRVRAPIVASIKRHQLPIRINSAISRVRKNEKRRHSLKIQTKKKK